MQYTFDNVTDIIESGKLNGFSCIVEEKPLPILQGVFDDMKKNYIDARNRKTEVMINEYGDEQGIQIMNDRYPSPTNIDELANQAKIIANKYEICGTTLIGNNPGFIVKIPKVRIRIRTYLNLGDYYCWIQKYGIDKFVLQIYQAMPNEEGFLEFGGANYPHPHIAGNGPCLGGYEAPIKNCAGHFNMVGVLSNIRKYLNSYYGRSVFLRQTEFRPIKYYTLPINILKKYSGTYVNWQNYYESLDKKPDYDTSTYWKIQDMYNDRYDAKKETIELYPHEGNFYLTKYSNMYLDPRNVSLIQKARLLQEYYNVSYWQAFAMICSHCSKQEKNITFDKKYEEYKEAYSYIIRTCIDKLDTTYSYGFNSNKIIRPDVSIDDEGLSHKAYDLLDIIHPRNNTKVETLSNEPCNIFWTKLTKYKNYEDFIYPESDYDERKDKAIAMIDKLMPEVIEWHDSYKRKIIITLESQKRRIQNGLKHTLPTPTSNQLSIETLSQD